VIAQSLPKAYKTILFDVFPGLPIQKSSHYSLEAFVDGPRRLVSVRSLQRFEHWLAANYPCEGGGFAVVARSSFLPAIVTCRVTCAWGEYNSISLLPDGSIEERYNRKDRSLFTVNPETFSRRRDLQDLENLLTKGVRRIHCYLLAKKESPIHPSRAAGADFDLQEPERF
jgi:hypothetical protein